MEQVKRALRVATVGGQRVSDEPLPGDEVTVVEDIEEPAEEADKAEVLTLIRQA